MPKVVDLQFQEKTQMWTAEVGGKLIEAPTARTLRFDVEKTIGGNAEIETRVAFDRATEKELDALAKESATLRKERARVDAAVDRLNMKRFQIAERLLAKKCSIEQVAARLDMNPTRLQQLRDPRQYGGRRMRGLIAGTIKPGDPPQQRSGKSGSEDDDAGE